MSIRC